MDVLRGALETVKKKARCSAAQATLQQLLLNSHCTFSLIALIRYCCLHRCFPLICERPVVTDEKGRGSKVLDVGGDN